MNLEIANRMLELRKTAGYSQEDLAARIGVSRQAISKWERGEASPDTDNFIALAELYGVSLDELLLGKPPKAAAPVNSSKVSGPETSDGEPASKPAAESAAAADAEPNAVPNAESDSATPKKDRVWFDGALHVDSKDGDRVDVGFGGVHVDAKDGSHVHIDRHGVYVSETGEAKNHLHSRGDGDKVTSFFHWFPYPALITMVYLVLGLCFSLWHPGWLLFLTIPLYYTAIDAVKKRNADHFAYPVLVVLVYLWLGCVWNLWHPYWILFLTIPLYYWIVAMIRALQKRS